MAGDFEDQQLIRQFQDEGSAAAFEQLVRRHIGKVRTLMMRMSIRECDADDLTQEVFIKVYRFLPEFRRDARFSTWLYRIAANTAKSFFRKKGWQALSPDDQIDQSFPASSPGQDHHLLARELDDRVGQAIQRLPADLRTAVVLTVIEEISYPEAARIEGCTVATLYWRVFKGRQLLKDMLKEYLDEETE